MYNVYYADFDAANELNGIKPKRLRPNQGTDYIVFPQRAAVRDTQRQAVSYGRSVSRPFVVTYEDRALREDVVYAEGHCVRGHEYDRVEAVDSAGRDWSTVGSDRAGATVPVPERVTIATIRNHNGTPSLFLGDIYVADLTYEQAKEYLSALLASGNE